MWTDRSTRNVVRVIPPFLRRQGVQDALIGVVFYLSVMLITIRIDNAETSTPGHRFDGLTAFLILGASVALAFRHRLPRLHLYVILGLTVVYIARDYVGGPFFLAIFIAIGTVASILPTREALRPAVIAFVAMAISGFVVDSEETEGWAHLLYLSWSVVAFLAGKTIRDRRELLDGLRKRNQQLEETREEEALRRVAEERVRIARDLHDIVAHNIAGISLQAATGAHVAEAHPDAGPCRAPGHPGGQPPDPRRAPRRPSTCCGRVTTTPRWRRRRAWTPSTSYRLGGRQRRADHARGAGRHLRRCPTPSTGAAYRIIQESLTNVMRHAGPARATVQVDRVTDGLSVESRTTAGRVGDRQDGPRHRPRPVRHAGAGAGAGRQRRGRAPARRRVPGPGVAPVDRRRARGDLARGGPGVIRVLIADDQALVRAGLRVLIDAEDASRSSARPNDGARGRRPRPRAPAPTSSSWTSACPSSTGSPPPARSWPTRSWTRCGCCPDDVRARRVRVRGAARRGQRLPVKDTEPVELLRAIRVVAEGEALLSPGVTRRLIGEFVARPERPLGRRRRPRPR